jgi:hypothetical protein
MGTIKKIQKIHLDKKRKKKKIRQCNSIAWTKDFLKKRNNIFFSNHFDFCKHCHLNTSKKHPFYFSKNIYENVKKKQIKQTE